jgi:tetrahydromethanopterin S-methyltransferase subunit G
MAENVENLVLEYLRRLDKKVDGLAEDVREIRTTQAAMPQLLASHDNHMLRMEMRLERIEKRLDLVDPVLPG